MKLVLGKKLMTIEIQNKWYKIVDIENDVVKTLFHSVNGSRKLSINKWLESTMKMVSDGSGGTKYLTGFHIMKTIDESIIYINRFDNKNKKGIVQVEVQNVWKKEHSPSNVWLSEKIKIGDVVWLYNENITK